MWVTRRSGAAVRQAIGDIGCVTERYAGHDLRRLVLALQPPPSLALTLNGIVTATGLQAASVPPLTALKLLQLRFSVARPPRPERPEAYGGR